MSSFDKLKDYLNENKSGSSSSTNSLSSFKFETPTTNPFTKWFKKSNDSRSLNGLDQNLNGNDTDSWFKDAESDPCCPKLV